MTSDRHASLGAFAYASARAYAFACAFACVLASTSSCTRERSDFGRPCIDDAACDEGSLCLQGACVAEREPDGAGESCAQPMPLQRPAALAPLALGSVTTSFGAATLDEEMPARCASSSEAHDLVFRFELAEESGVRVLVTADFPTAIAVRPLVDARCAAGANERCTGADAAPVSGDGRTRELLVPRLAAGTHAVVVSAPRDAGGAVRVDVELIDCPVGYMPVARAGALDDADSDDACIGWREIERLPIPGVGARAAAIPNGIVLAGGNPLDAPRDAAAFFDTTTESWSFILLEEPIGSAGIIALADGTAVIIGDDEFAASVSFQTIDSATLRVIDDDALSSPFNEGVERIDIVAASVGGLALVPGELVTFLRISPREAPCDLGICPSPFQCVETLDGNGNTSRRCACLIEPCGPPPSGYVLALEEDDVVRVPLGASFAFAQLSGAPAPRTLISGFADGQARLFDALSDSFAVRPNLVHRAGAALTALDGSDVALSGGAASGGAEELAPAVDVYDVDNGGLRTFAVPGAARRDHTASFAFGHVVLIGGRDAAGALARTTLVDPDTGATVELEDIPEPRVDHVALALDADRLLVAGGSRGDGVAAPRSFILERVRRGRPAPVPDGAPAPLVPPEDCDFITDLDLSSGSSVVEGTTEGRRDEVRTDLCSASAGRESIYRFSLDEPAHVVIEVDAEVDRPVWVARGPCRDEDRVDVSCAFSSIELLSLDAGSWLVVVEASFFEENDRGGNGAFTLSVRNVGAATDICAGDAFDPDDDALNRPRRMLREGADGAGQAAFSAFGALCPGDVDHVLLEHPGGFFRASLSGLDPALVDIVAADVDVDASAAAGEPVVVPRAGELRPLAAVSDRDLEAGPYVLALHAPDLEGAAVRPLWELTVDPFCVADAYDSLVPPLDDALLPSARATLAPGVISHLALCLPGDVDVLPLDFSSQGAGSGDLLVDVDGPEAGASLHALLADGTLGAALSADVTSSTSGVQLRVAEALVPAAVALRVAQTGDFFDDRISAMFRRVGGPGDRCTQPIALSPDEGTRSFQTVVFSDDVDASTIGDCTGFRTPGLDSFYSVSLDTGDTLIVDAVGTAGESPDVALYVVDTCPPVAPDACLAGVDVGFTLEPEHFELTNSGPPGTFFLVVDSFFGTAFDVDLTWSVVRP